MLTNNPHHGIYNCTTDPRRAIGNNKVNMLFGSRFVSDVYTTLMRLFNFHSNVNLAKKYCSYIIIHLMSAFALVLMLMAN
jgi:hypothetical protein